jgi:hypothetical protein
MREKLAYPATPGLSASIAHLVCCICVTISGPATASADSGLESELFGAPKDDPQPSANAPADAPADAPAAGERPGSGAASLLKDTTTAIGGRADWTLGLSRQDEEPLSKATWTSSPKAYLFVDSRPREDLRGYLRFSIKPTSSANATMIGSSAQGQSDTSPLSLLELWIKWQPAGEGIFWTLGRQPIKWGNAQFWNPTDFLAEETRNPLAFFDDRSGIDAARLNIPLEGANASFTFIVSSPRSSPVTTIQTPDGRQAAQNETTTLKDLQLAARAEWSVASSEIAASIAWRENGPTRYGIGLSSGIGPLDLELEGACTAESNRTFFKQLEKPDGSVTAVPEDRDQLCLPQGVAGLSWEFGYADNDSAALGAEYFWNGLGHSEPILELASVVSGNATPLYVAEQYAAAYVLLPSPGSWEDTTIQATYIKNLSDFSELYRLSIVETIMEFSLISVGANYRNGLGEFRVNTNDLKALFNGVDGGLRTAEIFEKSTPKFSLDATFSVSL